MNMRKKPDFVFIESNDIDTLETGIEDAIKEGYGQPFMMESLETKIAVLSRVWLK